MLDYTPIFIIFAVFFLVIAIAVIYKSYNEKPKEGSTPKKEDHLFSSQHRGEIDLATEIRGKARSSTSTSAPRKVTPPQTMSTPQRHTHPSAQGNIRKEKVYTESSMGEHLSEGCKPHYYERYILVRPDAQELGVNQDLARIVVLGEVLNNPAFKKYRR